MARGREKDMYVCIQSQGVAPVCFMNDIFWDSPAPEVRPGTKSAENILDFWSEPHNGGVVQVIPMIMRNQQAVDIWHIVNGVWRSSGKGLCAE